MLSEYDFQQLIKNSPLISIDIIIENNSNQYLLGLRKNAPARGQYFVPGGRIFKNENFESAVKRISRSELGFEIKMSDLKLLGVFEQFYQENYYDNLEFGTHYISMPYVYLPKVNTDFQLDPQHEKFVFWKYDDILKNSLVSPYCQKYFIEMRSLERQELYV